MCEKINFVCNPRIIVFNCPEYGERESSYTWLPLETLLTSDLWTKQLSYLISSTKQFPATVLEIALTNYKLIYTARIRYWDGVGIYEVNATFDSKTDKRIELEMEYLSL